MEPLNNSPKQLVTETITQLQEPEAASNASVYSRALKNEGCCVKGGVPERVELLKVRHPSPSPNDDEPRWFESHSFSSKDELMNHLSSDVDKAWDARIFSLVQKHSRQSLTVSEPTLSSLLTSLAVHPDFTKVIQLFSSRRRATEESYCGHWFWKPWTTRFELSYVVKFPTRILDDPLRSWAIRQNGIYHSVYLASKRSDWIFLHSQNDTSGHHCMNVAITSNEEKVLALIAHPAQQHVELISHSFDNWRQYMLEYEYELDEIRLPLHSAPLKNLSLDTNTLSRVRFIESRLLPLPNIFRSYDETCQGLLHLNNSLYERLGVPLEDKVEVECALQNLRRQNTAYEEQARFLLRSVSHIAQQFADTISLRNNAYVREMTRFGMKDSATIKVITVISLGCLPVTTLGTLFGSQLIYLTPSRKLAFSPDWWVILVLAVPLTTMTVLMWWFFKARNERKMDALYNKGDDGGEL